MFGGDPGNFGVTAADGPRDPEVARRFETPTRMVTDPVVGDGTVVWTTATAAHAHDAATCEERFRFEPVRGTGSPAIADGVACLGYMETSFHALEVASGEPAWSVETTTRPSAAPVVAGSAVYYGPGAHRVYARDTASGETLWYR